MIAPFRNGNGLPPLALGCRGQIGPDVLLEGLSRACQRCINVHLQSTAGPGRVAADPTHGVTTLATSPQRLGTAGAARACTHRQLSAGRSPLCPASAERGMWLHWVLSCGDMQNCRALKARSILLPQTGLPGGWCCRRRAGAGRLVPCRPGCAMTRAGPGRSLPAAPGRPPPARTAARGCCGTAAGMQGICLIAAGASSSPCKSGGAGAPRPRARLYKPASVDTTRRLQGRAGQPHLATASRGVCGAPCCDLGCMPVGLPVGLPLAALLPPRRQDLGRVRPRSP